MMLHARDIGLAPCSFRAPRPGVTSWSNCDWNILAFFPTMLHHIVLPAVVFRSALKAQKCKRRSAQQSIHSRINQVTSKAVEVTFK
jgi:hypothetical protein